MMSKRPKITLKIVKSILVLFEKASIISGVKEDGINHRVVQLPED